MSKSGGMARFFWTTMVVAVVVYVVFAVIMLVYLPRKVKLAESRLPGIQQAIAECAADQLLLSKRVTALTDQGIKEGHPKVDILNRMLSDPDLNRLALNYTGFDFATARSSFLTAIKHSRDLLKSQKSVYTKEKEQKDFVAQKLRQLESRRKYLLNISKSTHDEHASERELHDIEEQISHYRGIEWSRELKNEKGKDTYANAGAQLEAQLFNLATDCEKNTIIALERSIAERKGTFVKDEQQTILLRNVYDKLNIWPLPALQKLFFDGSQPL